MSDVISDHDDIGIVTAEDSEAYTTSVESEGDSEAMASSTAAPPAEDLSNELLSKAERHCDTSTSLAVTAHPAVGGKSRSAQALRRLSSIARAFTYQ